MSREIRFRAWVPKIETMLEGVVVYSTGSIGLSPEDFEDSLNEKYEFDGDEVRTKLSEDGHSGGERVLTPPIGDEWMWIEEGEHTPMQYTGLKDKSGVEIYEGDVLRLAPEYTGAFETPQIVVFEDGRFLYQSTTYHGHKNDISQSLCANHVVIGNIYANPELIPA